MSKVTRMASSLVSRVESGEMGMKDINPMELSKQMLSGMSQDDLDSFGQELMGGGGDIAGLMSMVQGMVGSMGSESGMPGLASMLSADGGGAGAGGMAALAALMGGSAGGGGGSSGGPFKNLRRLQ